jgi:hypothetical protein
VSEMEWSYGLYHSHNWLPKAAMSTEFNDSLVTRCARWFIPAMVVKAARQLRSLSQKYGSGYQHITLDERRAWRICGKAPELDAVAYMYGCRQANVTSAIFCPQVLPCHAELRKMYDELRELMQSGTIGGVRISPM